MVKRGIQLTCAGCGASTFIEVSPLKMEGYMPFNDRSDVTHYDPDQSESWVKVRSTRDLCPRCQKIREKKLCEFYEECGAAGDKEVTENERI